MVAQEYALGDGVTRDNVEADRWFKRAAASDEKLIRPIFRFHAGRKNNVTRTVNWYARLPTPVGAEDMLRMGRRYLYAKRDQRNARKALRLLTRAAENGAVEAHEEIGTMYFKGLGVTRDYAIARWHFLQSLSPMGSAYPLGIMYLRGLGIGRDTGSSRLWLEVAARAGHPIAAKKIAELHASEEPATGANQLNAFAWHLAAAALGSTSSRYRAMRMYMDMPLEMGVAAKAKAARIMVGIRHKSVRGQLPG